MPRLRAAYIARCERLYYSRQILAHRIEHCAQKLAVSKPAITGVHEAEAKNVAERGTFDFRVLAAEDEMRPSSHSEISDYDMVGTTGFGTSPDLQQL
jgi:hypothetical protein